MRCCLVWGDSWSPIHSYQVSHLCPNTDQNGHNHLADRFHREFTVRHCARNKLEFDVILIKQLLFDGSTIMKRKTDLYYCYSPINNFGSMLPHQETALAQIVFHFPMFENNTSLVVVSLLLSSCMNWCRNRGALDSTCLGHTRRKSKRDKMCGRRM